VESESSEMRRLLLDPTTEDVPPTLLKRTVSFCRNEFPTETPVAVPEIAVTVATVSMVAFHALLFPFGMTRLVVPVPSKERIVVEAEDKLAYLQGIKFDDWCVLADPCDPPCTN